MGEKKKSSAAPMIVTTFKDLHVIDIGLGYMHGVFVVRDETDKDKKELEKFPLLSFEDSKTVAAEEAPTKKGKGKGTKAKAPAKKTAAGRKKK